MPRGGGMCIALHFTTHHDNGVGTGGHGVILCFSGGRGGGFLGDGSARRRRYTRTSSLCALARPTLAYLPILSKEARTAAAVLDTTGEQATTLITEYPAWHGWSVWSFGGRRCEGSGIRKKNRPGKKRKGPYFDSDSSGLGGSRYSQLCSSWFCLFLMLGLGWNLV